MRQATPTTTTSPTESTPTESTSTRSPTTLDGEPVPVSEQVVAVVAAVTDADPTETEPLYRSLDPDSLDALFAGVRSDGCDGRVAFTFAGCDVVVRSDETVAVTPPGETEPAWDTATDAVPPLSPR